MATATWRGGSAGHWTTRPLDGSSSHGAPVAAAAAVSFPPSREQQQQQQWEEEWPSTFTTTPPPSPPLLPGQSQAPSNNNSSSSSVVVEWNQGIAWLARAGRTRDALAKYRHLVDSSSVSGVHPNKHTFLSVLKACGSSTSLDDVKRIHADIVRFGCDSDVFVCNSLIHKYAACGSVRDARAVFDALADGRRSVVSWNAMVAGYVEHGDPREALRLVEGMRAAGVRPTDRTFVAAIKACGRLGTSSEEDGKAEALRRGREVYAQVTAQGLAGNLFVACSAVDMFARCGSVGDARAVFDAMPERDLATWNAMVAGYVEAERAEEALELHCEMGRRGVRADVRTYVSLFKACSVLAAGWESGGGEECGKEEALRRGRALVAQMEVELDMELDGAMASSSSSSSSSRGGGYGRHGNSNNAFVRSAMVNMYAACGAVSAARAVFDSSSPSERLDVVLWNAMIAGYADNERGDEALQLFDQIISGGGAGAEAKPNDRTLVSALKACACLAVQERPRACAVAGEPRVSVQALRRTESVYAEATARGLARDVFVATAAVSAFASCGSVRRARALFDAMPRRSAVSWNAMVGGYAEQGDADGAADAVRAYREMRAAGVPPTDRTFLHVLTACAVLGQDGDEDDEAAAAARSVGAEVHAEAVARGMMGVCIANSVVAMYAACGDTAAARAVFDAMPRRTAVSWTVMVAGYADAEQGEAAVRLFEDMVTGGGGRGVRPDDNTFVAALRACSATGDLRACRAIHHHWTTLPAAAPSAAAPAGRGGTGGQQRTASSAAVVVTTALVHAYGKCGSMSDAERAFRDIPAAPDAVAWTALIAGHARHGDVAACFRCYRAMLDSGTRPTGVTFLSLLAACSHAGLVQAGLDLLAAMPRDHAVPPAPHHHACVVDMLARAGMLRAAEDLLLSSSPSSSPSPAPDVSAGWLAMLAACQKFGDVEAGRRAFARAVELDPRHPAAYVLMANIYAAAGMRRRAREVHEVRRWAGAVKAPGHTWLLLHDDLVVGEERDRRTRQEPKKVFRAGETPGRHLQWQLDDIRLRLLKAGYHAVYDRGDGYLGDGYDDDHHGCDDDADEEDEGCDGHDDSGEARTSLGFL